MKTNLFKLILTFFLSFALSSVGLCTQLPVKVVRFVLEKFPETNIRFDGLIELPDETEYLPILPVINIESEKCLEIVQTIPANTDFSEKPDMILFNNNLALLKIIKKEGEPPTVISSNQMPLKVKLGILPQDLVVPKGLILPQELKVILGDLKIPLKEKTDKEGEIAFYNRTEEKKSSPEKEVNLIGKTTENAFNLPELEFLSGKKLYTINHKDNKVYVLNSGTGRINKIISLPSVPSDMHLTPDERYILLVCAPINKIFVIDTTDDEFVKSIDVRHFPSSIVSDEREQKAYVANKFSENITIIDLRNMQVTNSIPVKGSPDNLYLSEDKGEILYSDYRTGNIHKLNINSTIVTDLFHDKNIIKLAQANEFVFSLSRSENTVTVFDTKKEKIIKKIETGEKPTDIKIIENMRKILIVCAEPATVNIIDMDKLEVIKSIALENNGFPGKIEIVQNLGGKGRALITDFDAYEVAIYDLDKDKILGYIPVSNIVGSIVISK